VHSGLKLTLCLPCTAEQTDAEEFLDANRSITTEIDAELYTKDYTSHSR